MHISPRALLPAALCAALLFVACDEPASGSDADAALADASPTDASGVDATSDRAAIAEPASGSMAGYHPVVFDPAPIDATDVIEITVAGIAAYGIEVTADNRLRAVVQGAPVAGPAAVEVTTSDGTVHALGDAYTYLPPLDPRFTRIAAIGASVGQGVQRGVPDAHGALMSPPAQLARRLGGFMPLPMPIDGLFIPMSVADFGPAPECDSPTIAAFVLGQSPGLIQRLGGTGGRGFSMHLGRHDPDLDPGNVSTGSSRIGDVLAPPAADNLPARLLAHLVYDPYNDPLGPVARSQFDVLEAYQPTLVVSFDLFGNDLINSVADTAIDPSVNTPPEELYPAIEAVVDRLAALDAEVFLADLPRPSGLSRVALLRAQADAAGTLAETDATLAAIDAEAEAANAVLRAAADRHPDVHVVPLAALVESVGATGLTLDGETIDVRRFGGLIGLDGVHFTDTGYALVADLFVTHIGATLGLDLPPIDVEAAFIADVERPSRLAAEGFDREVCHR